MSGGAEGGVSAGGEGGLCARGEAGGEGGDQGPVQGRARHPVQDRDQGQAAEEMCSCRRGEMSLGGQSLQTGGPSTGDTFL